MASSNEIVQYDVPLTTIHKMYVQLMKAFKALKQKNEYLEELNKRADSIIKKLNDELRMRPK